MFCQGRFPAQWIARPAFVYEDAADVRARFNVGLPKSVVPLVAVILDIFKCLYASSVISSMKSIIVPGYLSVSRFQNLPIHIYMASTT